MKNLIIAVLLSFSLSVNAEARTKQEAIDICHKGNAQMCMGLGDDMKKRNPKEAKKYYDRGLQIVKKACSKNSADNCFVLGSYYAFGKGVKVNTKKAIATWKKAYSLFQKSCKKGNQTSCESAEHCQAMIEMAPQ